MMKKIKINFVDFQKDLSENNDFFDILSRHYHVEISDNPDYLFYSVFGTDHLKYKKCVKIFYTGECVTPNFNECDYAIGFDRLTFGDRYLRQPLYSLFKYKANYEKLFVRRFITEADISDKTDFCNYVVSNSFVKDRRTEVFLKLSEYKRVNSGGRYMNNIGGAVKDKYAFQRKHKFSIAFENCSYDGYATEKLVDAFAAETIPIYWGDPRIGEDFNENAFVNCHNFGSLEEVVERVREIDQDNLLFLSMVNQPIVRKRPESLEAFLCHIFDQDLNQAYRRSFSRSSLAYEDCQFRHKFYEDNIYVYIARLKNLIFRLKNDNVHSRNRSK